MSVPEVQTAEWPLGPSPCSASGSLLGFQDLNQWLDPDPHRPSETGTPGSPLPGIRTNRATDKHNEQEENQELKYVKYESCTSRGQL